MSADHSSCHRCDRSDQQCDVETCKPARIEMRPQQEQIVQLPQVAELVGHVASERSSMAFMQMSYGIAAQAANQVAETRGCQLAHLRAPSHFLLQNHERRHHEL